MSWYLAVLGKYAVFAGRARRKEYWMFSLINFLISFAMGIIALIVTGGVGRGYNIITACYALFILIPGIAVSVRRLHDIGRSGWWLWIAVVPLLGAIVLLIFAIQDSEPGPNAYGPNPKTEFA